MARKATNKALAVSGNGKGSKGSKGSKAPKGKGKAAKAPRAARTTLKPFNPKATIKLLVTENPKNKGTAEHKRFATYRNGATVAALMAAGHTTLNLLRDSTPRRGGKPYIAIKG